MKQLLDRWRGELALRDETSGWALFHQLREVVLWMRGDQDDGGRSRGVRGEPAGYGETILTAEVNVEQDHVRRELPSALESVAFVRCNPDHGKPLLFEQRARGREERVVVIDDQAAHNMSIAAGMLGSIAASWNSNPDESRNDRVALTAMTSDAACVRLHLSDAGI